MGVPVAIVKIMGDPVAAIRQGLDLIGGIPELNNASRDVVVKVGIFDHRISHHASVEVVGAIASAFDQAPHILLAESDNYCGKALDRLEKCYGALFDQRIIPYSLSEGPDMRELSIAGESMAISPILFKPNVFVSTHVWRTFTKGSLLKNLFGCTPMVKKARFHKYELYSNLLADIFEATGGIDLAVLDGTFLYKDATDRRVEAGVLMMGRDAVAVETVGAALAGVNPEKMPVIQEFARRGLGEGDMRQIEIVGASPGELAQLKRLRKELQAVSKSIPRAPGISKTIDQLAREGWLDTYHSISEVVAALKERGVLYAKDEVVRTTLNRRVGKTLERSKEGSQWMYRRKQA